MKTAAVVVTFNRKEMLRECLDALLAQTEPLNEIIVVDNASTDGTLEMLASEVPEATVLSLSENLGGAGGFARGIQMAYEKGYDWIWVMDDDAIPVVDALAQLVKSIERLDSEPIGALQCAVFNYKERIPGIAECTQGFFEGLRRGFAKRMSDLNSMREIDTFPFLGPLINARFVATGGIPRVKFFVYGDDREYSFRMRKLGFCVYLVPDAVILHKPYDEKPTGGLKALRRKNSRLIYYGYRNHIAILLEYFRFIGVTTGTGAFFHYLVRGLLLAFASLLVGRGDMAKAVLRAIVDGILWGLHLSRRRDQCPVGTH